METAATRKRINEIKKKKKKKKRNCTSGKSNTNPSNSSSGTFHSENSRSALCVEFQPTARLSMVQYVIFRMNEPNYPDIVTVSHNVPRGDKSRGTASVVRDKWITRNTVVNTP